MQIQSDDSRKRNDKDRPAPFPQLIWGIALFLMGIAVMFQAESVVNRLSAGATAPSGMYFLRFCIYLMAVILMGGGIKKINRFRMPGKEEDISGKGPSPP